MKNLVTKF